MKGRKQQDNTKIHVTTASEYIKAQKGRKGRTFWKNRIPSAVIDGRVQENRSVKGNMCNELYKAVYIKMNVLMKSDFKMKAQIQIISPMAKTNMHSAVISNVITSE